MNYAEFINLHTKYISLKGQEDKTLQDNVNFIFLQKEYTIACQQIEDETVLALKKLKIFYKGRDKNVSDLIKYKVIKAKLENEIKKLKEQKSLSPSKWAQENKLSKRNSGRLDELHQPKAALGMYYSTYENQARLITGQGPHYALEETQIDWEELRTRSYYNFQRIVFDLNKHKSQIYILSEKMYENGNHITIKDFLTYAGVKNLTVICKISILQIYERGRYFAFNKEITKDNILNFSEPFMFPVGFDVSAFITSYNRQADEALSLLKSTNLKEVTNDFVANFSDMNLFDNGSYILSPNAHLDGTLASSPPQKKIPQYSASSLDDSILSDSETPLTIIEAWFDVLKIFATKLVQANIVKDEWQKSDIITTLRVFCDIEIPNLPSLPQSAMTASTAIRKLEFNTWESDSFKDFFLYRDAHILIPTSSLLLYKDIADPGLKYVPTSDSFFRSEKILQLHGDVQNPYGLFQAAVGGQQTELLIIYALLETNSRLYAMHDILVMQKNLTPVSVLLPSAILNLEKTEKYLRTMPDFCKYLGQMLLQDIDLNTIVGVEYPIYVLKEFCQKKNTDTNNQKFIGYGHIDAITFKHTFNVETNTDEGLGVWKFKTILNDDVDFSQRAADKDITETQWYCQQLRQMTGISVFNFYIRYVVIKKPRKPVNPYNGLQLFLYTYRYDFIYFL